MSSILNNDNQEYVTKIMFESEFVGLSFNIRQWNTKNTIHYLEILRKYPVDAQFVFYLAELLEENCVK